MTKVLVGKVLMYERRRRLITKTETYRETDEPACHTFKERTKRNEAMPEKAGLVYVYLIYGMYYYMNIVTEKEGYGSAVLIRGVKDLETRKLFYGPGEFCRKFGINISDNQLDLICSKHSFLKNIGLQPKIKTTTRIGIKKGTDKP